MEAFDGGTAKRFSIWLGIVAVWVVCTLYVHEFRDKQDYKHSVKIEQTKSNVKIAEELVAKKFNTNKEGFRLTTVPGDLLNPSYWKSKDSVSKVEKDGEEYTVYFETKRVNSSGEELEFYEPIGVSKIIKTE